MGGAAEVEALPTVSCHASTVFGWGAASTRPISAKRFPVAIAMIWPSLSKSWQSHSWETPIRLAIALLILRSHFLFCDRTSYFVIAVLGNPYSSNNGSHHSSPNPCLNPSLYHRFDYFCLMDSLKKGGWGGS
ncbi:MAG: hypothetical protein F6K53_23400 [Moorea sp. SIO4A1]|nr:hypothetical protein [Moorena sp. SIO4A1]